MVSPQKEDRVREIDFNGVEQDDDFDGECASVNEVAQEEVLGIFRVAADFQQLQEIVVLAKNLN
jgi:hypothetical protein